jgi:DNA-binding transcriptional MerR regulator
MLQSIRIQHDKGHLMLYLPKFFEEAPLEDIRKALKLLKKHSSRNESAYEALDHFFPVWESGLKDRIARLRVRQREAEQIVQEAPHLRSHRKMLKLAVAAVKQAKVALDRCNKVADAYRA